LPEQLQWIEAVTAGTRDNNIAGGILDTVETLAAIVSVLNGSIVAFQHAVQELVNGRVGIDQ